ncbi:hypothetical protein PAHAL_8G022800 [Panicum hallii]|uniref:Uncharacterized protein n=1 Tax=Panicum hallii TaxID=206008 RepID=A0A2T8I7B4_9POAL|nr:hypothetical protein PAHAL_8G022800 [Panicum hallii]
MIGARIVSNLVVSKHDEKKSGNRLLVVYPSVPVPPQHPKRPAASGCRSGQRGGFFLEAAGNPRGISGRYPPSWLRRLPGAATTNRTMSPTPAAAPSASGDDEFTEVVVVRHGETSWNASRIVQGQMDPELNEIGRQQAVVVAHRRQKKPNQLPYTLLI